MTTIGNNPEIKVNPFIQTGQTAKPGTSNNTTSTVDMTSNNPAIKNAGVQEGVGDTFELSTKKEELSKEDKEKEKDLLGQGGDVKDQLKNQEGKKSWKDKLQGLISGNKASSTQSTQSLNNAKSQATATQAAMTKLNAESIAIAGENEVLTNEALELEEQDLELEEQEVELTDKQKDLETKIKNGENVEENQKELESLGGELSDIGAQRGKISAQRETIGGQLLRNSSTLGSIDLGLAKEQQNINKIADQAMTQAKARQTAANKDQQTSQVGQQIGQTMTTVGGLGTSVGGAMTAFFPTAPAGVPITAAGVGLGVAGSGVSAFSQEGGITAEGASNLATTTFNGASSIKGQFKPPTSPA